MLQQITTHSNIAKFHQQWSDNIMYSSLWEERTCVTFITCNWLPLNDEYNHLIFCFNAPSNKFPQINFPFLEIPVTSSNDDNDSVDSNKFPQINFPFLKISVTSSNNNNDSVDSLIVDPSIPLKYLFYKFNHVHLAQKIWIDISTVHFDHNQKFAIDISPIIQCIKHSFPNFNDIGYKLHLYYFNAAFCYLLNQEQDCADTKTTDCYYSALYHKNHPDKIDLYQFDLYLSWADGIECNSLFLPTDWLITTSILHQIMANCLFHLLTNKELHFWACIWEK